MSEYHWKTVSVVGFDELMQALDRADRKGYMPGALQEEWEGFNWVSAPKREWVGLTQAEIWQTVNDCSFNRDLHADKFARAIEAAHNIKEET